MNNKIVPHLWFDKEAEEAAEFYVSLFPDSKITGITTISGTPSGDVDIISFELWAAKFMSINAGPVFSFNPSLSFYVYCGSDNETERLYNALSENGNVMMPLDKHPWSNKYAWVQDKYGLSWQLDVSDINSSQKILPSLLFANEKSEKVKEAISFYGSVFHDLKVIQESPYDKSANLPEGTLLFAQFGLNGYLFNAMSSNMKHDFDFNEAVSFMVYCQDQEKIDYYWERLTSGGQEQACGWLKDKYGVSWQIIPDEMDDIISTSDKAKLGRVTEAMLKMVKLDINELKREYNK